MTGFAVTTKMTKVATGEREIVSREMPHALYIIYFTI
jgi:hypothetical protein